MAKLNDIIESLIKVKEHAKDDDTLFLVILDNQPFRITKIVGGSTVDGRKFGAVEVKITKEMVDTAIKEIGSHLNLPKDDLVKTNA